MIGYYFSIGFNPDPIGDYDEMWKILKQTTREICDNPQAIVTEARRLNAPETCPDGCADNYANPFDSHGHPVAIIDDGEENLIMATDTTGIKYHVCRAFMRLLIEAMHREKIEVSVDVA